MADLITAIKARAKLFVDDNYRNPLPQDYIVTETAMMIGASIQQEQDAIAFIKESYCFDTDEEAENHMKAAHEYLLLKQAEMRRNNLARAEFMPYEELNNEVDKPENRPIRQELYNVLARRFPDEQDDEELMK